MAEWLEEEGALDASVLLEQGARYRSDAEEAPERNLAVFVRPLVVLDTRKWFGDADLRLDALVVQGGTAEETLYQPHTFRFPRTADGDDLAQDENGLLIYFGKPKHFLVLSLMLSRDTKDTDDLAHLISKRARSEETGNAFADIGALAMAAPNLAAVTAGLKVALTLGEAAYELVRAVSPKCLGLYRASWLGSRDRFGIGRHPPRGVNNVKDFQFGYQIVVDEAESMPTE